MKRIVNENAPRGHYTPGMISNGLLFISGQTSADPASGLPPAGGFEAEMRMALGKLESVLAAAGCTKEDVVMCQIYLTTRDHWDMANAVYRDFFEQHRPARIVLPVGPLSMGCQVELFAIAEAK